MAKKVKKKTKVKADKPGCACIHDIEKYLRDHLKQKKTNLKEFTIVEGNLVHKSIYPHTKLFMPFEALVTYRKPNGEVSKPKKEKLNMFFTYCPFCGKEYPSAK